MRNYEKYAKEINDYIGINFCKDFICPHVLNVFDCGYMNCELCRTRQMIWLLEEYEEPETDWSKVKVDTPILVRDAEYEDWCRRYFAEYKDGIVYAWGGGNTSWTAYDDMNCWKYAKLAESEED